MCFSPKITEASPEFSMASLRSSGTPAKVYHPKKEIRAANGWRMLGWWNISPAADCADVYRDVRTSMKARIMHFLQWFPTKQILLDATSFTEKDMRVFLDEFIRVRPEVLHGKILIHSSCHSGTGKEYGRDGPAEKNRNILPCTGL